KLQRGIYVHCPCSTPGPDLVVRQLVGATSSTDSEKGNITVTTATGPDDSVPADQSTAVAEITVVRDANHTLGATIRSLGRCWMHAPYGLNIVDNCLICPVRE